MNRAANLARVLLIGAATLAALASSSTQEPPPAPPPMPQEQAAPTQPMDPAMALGLWRSSFGPVKIEADDTGGPGALVGVWSYDKEGQAVVGYFQGRLEGNLLRFSWHEPARPADLTGEGWLEFDPSGRRFTGKWWSRTRDRGGDWTGERSPAAPAPAPAATPAPPSKGDAEQAPPGGPPASDTI